MTPHQQKIYEDRLMELRMRTRGREPKDPVARLKFDMEQEACARIYALKYSGFPQEPSDNNDGKEKSDEK